MQSIRQIEQNESLLKEVYGDELVSPEKLYYPDSDTSDLLDRFSTIVPQDTDTLVLVDGAFDVPHPAHEWYLRHCRLIGAGITLDKLELDHTKENLQMVLASRMVALAVTVDADYKVNAKKGFSNSKGGVERPIFPWKARAQRLAGMSFNTHGQLHPTVDLVTVEGDPQHKNTPLEDSLTLARHLHESNLLSSLVVYSEHTATFETACDIGLDTKVISEDISYELNPFTGKPWSSSDIIRRAQGKKAEPHNGTLCLFPLQPRIKFGS